MDLIKKCESDLLKLKNCKNIKERRILLNEIDDCVIDAVSEISKNCLVGNLKLNKCEINKLKKYKKVFEILSRKTPLQKRKKIIIQKGGFLASILIPSALYLLQRYFNK